MGSLIDDEILDEFAVVAPLTSVARKVRERCDGVIDRVLVGFPRSVDEATVVAVLQEMRSCAMSTPIMDEAAKVFADPEGIRRRGETACGADPSARQRAGVMGRRARLPAVLGDHQARRHHGDRARQRRCSPTRRGRSWSTAEGDEQQAAIGVSTLIHMDDPQHRDVRAIGADWFRPKAMRALKVRVDELAKVYVDKMAGDRARNATSSSRSP